MAQWTETLEPYVKVIETVKQSALNPTAGEDLIIGITLISDAGPSVPTLVTSQSDFLKLYSSKDITEEYIKSLNILYTGDNKSTAETMWANAYRLAGSNTLLVTRASKADNIYFTKPLQKGDLNTYILRDGELMKKVPSFKIVLDIDLDDAHHDQDGWSININGVGIIGNRTTDEGAQYDYFVNSLPELIEKMNETSKFFSPDYTFYSDDKATIPVDESDPSIISVVFNEVYLGVDIIDTSDSRCPTGQQFIITCEPDWTPDNPDQKVINLNETAWSGFTAAEYYANNVYNTSTDLRVRIRRFNHDAVISKELSDPELNENSESPWVVLKNVLDTFTGKGTKEPSQTILERDFYEVCVLDPSKSESPLFFNLGNIIGRGDIEASELNDMLEMIQLKLPDNLRDLNLNYYGYDTDNFKWVEISEDTEGTESPKKTVNSYEELLKETEMVVDDIYAVGAEEPYTYYQYQSNGEDQVYANLSIDPAKYRILDVSDSDLKKALDKISQNEVYVVEGLCDLGNTEPSFQTYMANMAINENYFYPISTIQSTNYLSIANSASKISQDSYKLYVSAPWDIDTGTLGWKYYASPAVLYWEAVARNKRNNSEFAPILGQTTGIVQYQRPMAEFNKKTRQLLLSKRINVALWNNQTSAWNMNDNYTKQSVNNIMSDDGNSRLAIRISKAMPVILHQFIGWKISQRLWASAKSVIDYWFRFTIMPMQYTISAYNIIIDESNNPIEIQRQNKMVVKIEVKYMYSLKYIEVYHDILDVGMEFTGE